MWGVIAALIAAGVGGVLATQFWNEICHRAFALMRRHGLQRSHLASAVLWLERIGNAIRSTIVLKPRGAQPVATAHESISIDQIHDAELKAALARQTRVEVSILERLT